MGGVRHPQTRQLHRRQLHQQNQNQILNLNLNPRLNLYSGRACPSATAGKKAGATRKCTTLGAAVLDTEAIAQLRSAPRTCLLQCCSFQQQDGSRSQNAIVTKFQTQCFSNAVAALHERTPTSKQMVWRMFSLHAKLRVKICRSNCFIWRLISTQRLLSSRIH